MKHVFSLVLVSLLIVGFSHDAARGDYNPAVQEYVNYRTSLVTFQPEFTVEAARMLTKAQAVKKMNASKSSRYQVKADCISNDRELCYVTPLKTEFTSGGFQWYVWYESVPGWSRYAPVKTVMGKFPLNPGDNQRSFATFSYQGYWIPEVSTPDFYAFRLINNLAYGPDSQYQYMFFYPHTDYPLFFEEYYSNRYGTATQYYYQDGILSQVETARSGGLTDTLTARRSLKNGAYLDATGMTAEQAKQGTQVIPHGQWNDNGFFKVVD